MVLGRRMLRLLIATTIIMLGGYALYYQQNSTSLTFESIKSSIPKLYGGPSQQDEELSKDKSGTLKPLPAAGAEPPKTGAKSPEKASGSQEFDSKPVAPGVKLPASKPSTPVAKEPAPDSASPSADTSASASAGDEYNDTERDAFLSNFLSKMKELSPPQDLAVLKANSGLPEDLSDGERSKTAVTAKNLAKYLTVSQDHINTLKALHKDIVASLPEAPAKLYKKGRGIVLTGGGAYMAPMLSAVVWLRNHKIKEPVEVFMSKKEYVAELCETVLPSYNAECRLVEDIYDQKALSRFKYMGYPLKLLALMGSRYEESFFMDADSVPISKMEDLFSQEIYKKYEYVMWPDFWARSTIPEYYEVVGKPISLPKGGDRDTTPVPDYTGAIPQKQSTESGQLLVNKSKHFRSLLLNLYYNINGFEQYYPLLTAGAPGEGDKDCFAASAFVMGEEMYQVETKPGVLGYWEGEDFQGRAIIQFDPQSDFEQSQAEKGTEGSRPKIPAAVLHANGIKMNPLSLYCDRDKKTCNKRPNHRIFGPSEKAAANLLKGADYDIELDLFTCLNVVVCTHIAKATVTYQGFEGFDLASMCKLSTEHIEWLAANKA